MDPEQAQIDRVLEDVHAELSGFVFTAARNWQRSLKVDAERRSLLCFAIRDLQVTRARNHVLAGLEKLGAA